MYGCMDGWMYVCVGGSLKNQLKKIVDFLEYYTRDIQKIRWILTEELVKKSTIYSCAIILAIYWYASFPVPKECQHGLLYKLLFMYMVIFWRVSVLPPHELFFRLSLGAEKLC